METLKITQSAVSQAIDNDKMLVSNLFVILLMHYLFKGNSDSLWYVMDSRIS